MRFIFFSFLTFFNFIVLAESPFRLGVYSGAAVTGDTVAFELLKGGKLVVTTDYYDIDGKPKTHAQNVTIGSWSYKDPFLMLSFGAYKDRFRKEACPMTGICFKFQKSYSKKLSPLNAPYGFGKRL